MHGVNAEQDCSVVTFRIFVSLSRTKSFLHSKLYNLCNLACVLKELKNWFVLRIHYPRFFTSPFLFPCAVKSRGSWTTYWDLRISLTNIYGSVKDTGGTQVRKNISSCNPYTVNVNHTDISDIVEFPRVEIHVYVHTHTHRYVYIYLHI